MKPQQGGRFKFPFPWWRSCREWGELDWSIIQHLPETGTQGVFLF